MSKGFSMKYAHSFGTGATLEQLRADLVTRWDDLKEQLDRNDVRQIKRASRQLSETAQAIRDLEAGI